MLGVAISTSLHFVTRFIVPYESLISISDKDSWVGFGEMIKLGFVSI